VIVLFAGKNTNLQGNIRIVAGLAC